VPTCIAFFGGINLGGRNKLPMKELVELLDELGFHGARTVLQSGNVAFRCSRPQRPEIGRRIVAAIQRQYGFEPAILVLRIQELEHAVAANPFMDARRDAANLHLWFLADTPTNPDLERIERLKGPASARWRLDRKVFYLHAPDGLESSRLPDELEDCLGVTAIQRNWQVATKTLELGWDLA
jgi:uncharacterized protein (DUF1697 family)